MPNPTDDPKKTSVNADHNSNAVGSISVGGDISGNITIGNTTGYTAEQVSVLIAQIQSTFQPKSFDGRCPYQGLDVFEEEDAELFFGREKLVGDLVSRVKDSRTVFVTGPSGSGKSSLVRAGLIHALKQGAIRGSDRWLYATMKPGRDPFEALATAFSRLKSPELGIYFRQHVDQVKVLYECTESALTDNKNQRLVLFIDQFEEVFTQISNEAERVAFLNLLTHAATIENGRVVILFSMRSDFVSNCATYPQLNALLNQQFVQIGAMQPDELVSAIAQPALRVGLRIDPDLIAQIINEMKGEPGALPLMQFALKDLFDSQQEKSGVPALILSDYLQRGGIHKALERHADDSFSKLSKDEQELARSIFSGLIEIGRGTQDTKRTALFDELVPAHTKVAEVEAIVQKLADARLITTDEKDERETVTLAHEKMIDAWPWLKKLVNENRDSIALQNEIASDAKEWEEHKRDASYLYTGVRLLNSLEQLKSKKLVLSGTANEFVQAGHIRQRRGQLALIGGTATILVLLILAVIVFSRQSSANAQLAQQAQTASTLAVEQRATAQANAGEAHNQTIIARAGELSAESVSLQDRDFSTSLLLGIEAYRTLDSVQTRGTLFDNAGSHPHLIQYLTGHTLFVHSVAFSPDGKTLASGSDDGTIILWDVRTGQPIGQPLTEHGSNVYSVAFSPDGKTLASGSGGNTIILWDVATRQPIGQPLRGHSSSVSSLAFSPDGKTLASGSYDGTIILWNVATRHSDGTIIVWDVATRQRIGQPLTGYTSLVLSVSFSPDGKTLASGSSDNAINLWDVATRQPIGQPLAEHTSEVYIVAFSPDGKTLASGSNDHTIILWDMATRQPIGQPLAEHTSEVYIVAFSPDGKTLASGSNDNTIILWDVATRQPIGQPLRGHFSSVTSLAFSPDGKTLASGSNDYTIILWDVVSQLFGQTLRSHTNRISSVAFSPDGKTLASGSSDTTIILWNVRTGQPIDQPLKGHTSFVSSVAFSPDGKTLASGSNDTTIILWDVRTGQPIDQPLTGHTSSVNCVAFSPDGKMLASGSDDGTIIIWDVTTLQQVGQPLIHTSIVLSVVFSPDGKTLASGSSDTIILWDVATRQPIGQPLTEHTSVYSVAFSPDGKTLAYGSSDGNDDGNIVLWDVATRQPIGQPLTGHTRAVWNVAFSPDGKMLASGSGDNIIILWDVATGQPIGEPLTEHTDLVRSVAFSPDGKTLASGSYDHTIILWDIDLQSWIDQSCKRANRNFTHAEWVRYFPDEEYRKTCDQWPLDPETTVSPTPIP